MAKVSYQKNKFLLVVFIVTVLVSWVYVASIKLAFDSGYSSWFKLTPVLGFFYFAFALISAIYIYRRESIGYAVGSSVMLFGIVADFLTYAQADLSGAFHGLLLMAIIIVNIAVMVTLGLYGSRIRNNKKE